MKFRKVGLTNGMGQRLKLIILFLVFTVFVIFFSLVSLKILGSMLLEETSFCPEFIFREGMTVSEFGKVNRLPSPLLKKALGLTCTEGLQKRVQDLSLSHHEICSRVNDELVLRAKNENSAKVFIWIRKLLHNFGLVTQDIQRSGQCKTPRLWLHYWMFPFRSVINLAWEPDLHPELLDEVTFCKNRNIDYYKFRWSVDGPKDWNEVEKVIEIIDRCKKPVWIHCRGGKDRTGRLLAIWKKRKGYPLELIFKDFERYGTPAPWVEKLSYEDTEYPPSGYINAPYKDLRHAIR